MPDYAIVLTGLGGLILTWAAVVKLLLPFGRMVRGGWRRFWGMVDTFVGTDPVVSRATGKVLVERVPALADRLDNLEGTMNKLADVLADQNALRQVVESHESRISNNEGRISEHDSAIAALIAATYEKGAESVLKAQEIARQNVVEGEVDQ